MRTVKIEACREENYCKRKEIRDEMPKTSDYRDAGPYSHSLSCCPEPSIVRALIDDQTVLDHNEADTNEDFTDGTVNKSSSNT
jgi:hypothetical protein